MSEEKLKYKELIKEWEKLDNELRVVMHDEENMENKQKKVYGFSHLFSIDAKSKYFMNAYIGISIGIISADLSDMFRIREHPLPPLFKVLEVKENEWVIVELSSKDNFRRYEKDIKFVVRIEDGKLNFYGEKEKRKLNFYGEIEKTGVSIDKDQGYEIDIKLKDVVDKLEQIMPR